MIYDKSDAVRRAIAEHNARVHRMRKTKEARRIIVGMGLFFVGYMLLAILLRACLE